MRKRILAFALASVMAISLVPSMPAKAAEEEMEWYTLEEKQVYEMEEIVEETILSPEEVAEEVADTEINDIDEVTSEEIIEDTNQTIEAVEDYMYLTEENYPDKVLRDKLSEFCDFDKDGIIDNKSYPYNISMIWDTNISVDMAGIEKLIDNKVITALTIECANTNGYINITNLNAEGILFGLSLKRCKFNDDNFKVKKMSQAENCIFNTLEMTYIDSSFKGFVSCEIDKLIVNNTTGSSKTTLKFKGTTINKMTVNNTVNNLDFYLCIVPEIEYNNCTVDKLTCTDSTVNKRCVDGVKEAQFYNCKSEKLDISNSDVITRLDILGDGIRAVDISNSKNIEEAFIEDTSLEEFTAQNATGLTYLVITAPSSNNINIKNCINLDDLTLETDSENIDLSTNKKLSDLTLIDKKIESLDLSKYPELSSLTIDIKPMDSLSLVNLKKLRFLNIISEIKNVDVSNLKGLGYATINATESVNMNGTGYSSDSYFRFTITGPIEKLYLDDYVRADISILDASRLSQTEYRKLSNVVELLILNYKYDYELDIFNHLERLTIDKKVDLDISSLYKLKELGFYYNENKPESFAGIGNITMYKGQNVSFVMRDEKEGKHMTAGGEIKSLNQNILSTDWDYEFTYALANNTGKTVVKYNPIGKVIDNSDEFIVTVVDSNNEIFGDVNLEIIRNTNYLYLETTIDGVENINKFSYKYEYSNDGGTTWESFLLHDGAEVGMSEIYVMPEVHGTLQIKVTVEETATGTKKNTEKVVEYHPSIKGNCQLPYGMIEPGQPGYLIGLETYEPYWEIDIVIPPKAVDTVEMLILDCTTMQWVYTTGKNPVPENMLWTVWQPEYGYYWTLFRAYDKNGNIIDEVCYGFANIC